MSPRTNWPRSYNVTTRTRRATRPRTASGSLPCSTSNSQVTACHEGHHHRDRRHHGDRGPDAGQAGGVVVVEEAARRSAQPIRTGWGRGRGAIPPDGSASTSSSEPSVSPTSPRSATATTVSAFGSGAVGGRWIDEQLRLPCNGVAAGRVSIHQRCSPVRRHSAEFGGVQGTVIDDHQQEQQFLLTPGPQVRRLA